MTVPVVENVTTDTAANGGDLVFTKPTGLTAGDLMLVPIGMGDSGEDTFDAPSDAWDAFMYNKSTNVTLIVWAKIADSADVAASDFTFVSQGGASQSGCGAMYRVSGVYGLPVSRSGYTSGTSASATQTCPDITTQSDDCMVFRFVAVADNVAITVDAGITSDFAIQQNDTDPCALAGGHLALASEGAPGTSDFTTSASELYVSSTVAISPTGSPFPIVESWANDSAINGASLVIPKPAGLIVGDLLVAIVAWNTVTSADLKSGWTSIANIDAALASRAQFKIADSGDVAASDFTFTVTGSGTSDSGAGILYRISNFDAGSPIDVSGTGTGSSQNPICPDVTTTVDDCLLMQPAVLAGTIGGKGTQTPPSGGTRESWISANDTNDCTATSGYDVLATAGATGTATWSITPAAAQDWHGYTIAIAPEVADTVPGLRVMAGMGT